ncbi:hypothetical protein R1flu_028962 [Riccia fluitans]|uniref:Uncharacterized protein n=1 Tax=Riccia fluitans TaxID=41844 RepID=A0ABD1XN60_9MARC
MNQRGPKSKPVVEGDENKTSCAEVADSLPRFSLVYAHFRHVSICISGILQHYTTLALRLFFQEGRKPFSPAVVKVAEDDAFRVNDRQKTDLEFRRERDLS